MAVADISSGTAAGLMEFLDFMGEKGYATPRSMDVLKSAARQIFAIVEGADFDDVDVAGLDIDQYLSRFENRSMGRYSAKSLMAYRSRFRRGIESYRSYLENPNWMPAKRPSSDRRTATGQQKATAAKPRQPATRGKTDTYQDAAAQSDGSMAAITYPFPLKSGQMAQLRLPTKLDPSDADRLVAFLRALVVQESRPSASGDGD